MEYWHLKNLDKYIPNYKDRTNSWIKLYFRDSQHPQNKDIHYHNLLTDQEVEQLDELNRYRLISIMLVEALLGRPIPVEQKAHNKYTLLMGWDLRKCPISRTRRLLQPFIEVCYSDSKRPNAVTERANTEKEKEKEKEIYRRPRKFTPPTVEEVQGYINENQYDVNATEFVKYYAAADWHDQTGKPVRSWKQKLIAVWVKDKPKTKKCAKCVKDGVYIRADDTGQKYWLCEDHKPAPEPLPAGIPVPQMKSVGDVGATQKQKEQRRQKIQRQLKQ